ncbi:hypothetical protein RvY_02025 [Ramazzottius varieornatus]|uniref:Uncharacterized protein n=1 Tax=Ramazzottius varieornatus TaxID=947166 RepID=A0A1D1UTH0_RAMVA|nr:hypothetical protein RvY_02025 [Ramazzottius varieornatus]
MDSVNPMNILKPLETEYEQHFQSRDTPSATDQLLKTLIIGFLDTHISQGGCPVLATEEDLQYEVPNNFSTFDESQKSIAETNPLNSHTEDGFEAAADDRLTNYEPPSNETEPSSRELFFPTIPDPRVPFDQAADVDYKKRAVNF